MNSRAFAVQDTRRLSPALVRVESLFSVSVRVNEDRPRDEPPPPGRSEWVSVSGATADSCTRAQSYIEAICLPESTVSVQCSAACVRVLFADSPGLRDAIEYEFTAFLKQAPTGIIVQGTKHSTEKAVAKISSLVETMNNSDIPGSNAGHAPPLLPPTSSSQQAQVDPIHALIQLTAANPSVRDAILRELSKGYAEQQPQNSLLSRGTENNLQRQIETFSRLGYLEHEVQCVLESLGPEASYNDVVTRLVMTHPPRVRPVTSSSIVTPITLSSTNQQSTSSSMSIGDHMQSLSSSQPQRDGLRPIVIDGSNVAMRHGGGQVFSCRGILLAVQWFKRRGHNKITVFVPQWRKEASKPDSPIIDQDILFQLEREEIVNFTPSRRIGQKRIVCYDDRFIVRVAAETGGVIVSNDNFRDLMDEDPSWKEVIEKRLLMFTFADDLFMPPTDPLGRGGPHLDVFLRFDGGKAPSRDAPGDRSVPQDRQLCPYAGKCTFGPKCRFYHPEREQRMREREAAERTSKSTSPPSTSVLKSRGNIAETPTDLDLSSKLNQLSLHPSPTKHSTRQIGTPLTKANSGSNISDRDYPITHHPPTSHSMDSLPSCGLKHEPSPHPMTFPLQRLPYQHQQALQGQEDPRLISPTMRSASSDRLMGHHDGTGYLTYHSRMPEPSQLVYYNSHVPYPHPHHHPHNHSYPPTHAPPPPTRHHRPEMMMHAGMPHLCNLPPTTTSFSHTPPHPSMDPAHYSMVQYKHPDTNPLPHRCPPVTLPTRPHSARVHIPGEYSRESPVAISDLHQSFPTAETLAMQGRVHHAHN